MCLVRQREQRRIDVQPFKLCSPVIFGRVTRAVVKIEAYESEGDAERLHPSGLAPEPDNGNNNYKDSLYEGRDRVGDWGDEREEDKGEDVLRKVENPVEEEFQRKIDGGMFLGGSEEWSVTITLEERGEHGKSIGPEPDWGGEEEG